MEKRWERETLKAEDRRQRTKDGFKDDEVRRARRGVLTVVSGPLSVARKAWSMGHGAWGKKRKARKGLEECWQQAAGSR